MTSHGIRPWEPRDLDAVVALSLRAWAPVFPEIEAALQPAVYEHFHPRGWETSQREAVTAVCRDEAIAVWVAEDEGTPVGFVAVKLDDRSRMGEIYMIAVDPDRQGAGLGSALTDFALDRMREAGMEVAMVETGSDPGHAPARRLYERSGFGLMPVSRYFKKI